ncbi:MAG TPA: chemotaxis protein CheA [Polyangiaceae bacterium]|jgi:two-component system chemotaxis sensor kinase CheA|nr:chemotaxis protein CheA [Polyangiaceae bacterium]
MTDGIDKAREEFFSEAQELVESLSRNLLALDASLKRGTLDPSLVNEAFRAVHTLKGLAGLFGAKRVGALSHRLEDVLDGLRLGRLALTVEVLDLLFRAVEIYSAALAAERSKSDDPLPHLDDIIGEFGRIGSTAPAQKNTLARFELDAAMLAVLTEYEEHRLRTSVEQGLLLYRVRVDFDLATIDKALEDIKSRAKVHGEVITYLPTGSATSTDTIELDLLLASASTEEELRDSLSGERVSVAAIPIRSPASQPKATAPPERDAASRPPPLPSLVPRRGDVMSERAPLIEPPAEQAAALRAVAQTVRVDIRKLDALMNVVGELAIVKNTLGRLAERIRAEGHRQLGSELHSVQRSFDRRLGELQGGILEVRMVPLGQVFDRLARVVRQIGREMDKDIRLVITGAETEIDKLIVEELSDPLMHVVRNAIDHGIEHADERRRVGKPVAGTIALNAFQKGNHAVIEVEDDGRGIDERAILRRAVALGKVGPDDIGQLARNEILNLVFLPGLSTRDEASDYSGRGVGMDVVKTNISKLGGVIDLHSETDIGTKLTITLPVTLAIVSALLVRVAGRVFAMPLTSVAEAISLNEAEIRTLDGREVTTLRGVTLPVCRLAKVFGLAPLPGATSHRRGYIVVASLGSRRLGFAVDDLHGQQDIVIKALGKSLSRVRGFSGATELGDQRVALVLDPAALIEEMFSGDVVRERRLSHG